ncbi:MAG TPA: hypothetical protein VLW45_08600 [Pelomicrobium sp.]|nr:hypothetical protein [Pelomicrobium sp.]
MTKPPAPEQPSHPAVKRRRKPKTPEQNPQANVQTRRVLKQHYRAKYGVK